MEADIILDDFLQSETMHGLRYKWLIGDGDSSVYNAVQQGVITYGRRVDKLNVPTMPSSVTEIAWKISVSKTQIIKVEML